jgi:hypothetical protein
MELHDVPSYQSKKVIGKLYSCILDVNKTSYNYTTTMSLDLSLVEKEFIMSPLSPTTQSYLELQLNIYLEYKAEVENLLFQYNLNCESDLFAGQVVLQKKGHWRGLKVKKRRDYEVREQMLLHTQELIKKYRAIFWYDSDKKDQFADPFLCHSVHSVTPATNHFYHSYFVIQKASAWYFLACIIIIFHSLFLLVFFSEL